MPATGVAAGIPLPTPYPTLLQWVVPLWWVDHIKNWVDWGESMHFFLYFCAALLTFWGFGVILSLFWVVFVILSGFEPLVTLALIFPWVPMYILTVLEVARCLMEFALFYDESEIPWIPY